MMRPLLLTLLAIVSLDAAAQNADVLGTLFQTPQERVAIDRARNGEAAATGSFGTLRANPVITGYVKRSDGKSTVFIDNEPFEVSGSKADKLLQPRNVRSYVVPSAIDPPPATGNVAAAKANSTKGTGNDAKPGSGKTN
jgi:hypothetical protein